MFATGIKPLGAQAMDAHKDEHLASRVAIYCRVATIMYLTISLAFTTDRYWNSVLMEGMIPMYKDITGSSTKTLLSTVYDEVLLWCFTVYYLTLGHLCPEHQDAFDSLLTRFDISLDSASWPTLRGLLRRYLYHNAMSSRMLSMIERTAEGQSVPFVETLEDLSA